MQLSFVHHKNTLENWEGFLSRLDSDKRMADAMTLWQGITASHKFCEVGFEYVTEEYGDGGKIFRKRK